jgi:hypothetical protein
MGKISEKLVADFLAHQGYIDVEPHPDGNSSPPDFLVNGRIAVEVRRLNQNYYKAGTRTRGLEDSIPLRLKIKKLVLSLGPPTEDVSWFVGFRFRRPVEPWKKFKPKLRGALEGFINGATHMETRLEIGNRVRLEIFQASHLHSTFYVLGIIHDRDTSAWVIPEMEKNIRFVIDEKTKTIANVRSKYPEWWLVLADRIGYGDFDREQFCDKVSLPHDVWTKIILVDPQDHTRAFEI